jgi:hypothetical protein
MSGDAMSGSSRWWGRRPSRASAWLDEIDRASSPSGVDWSTVAVPLHPDWAGVVRPHPSSVEVGETALARLGGRWRDADRTDALICVWRVVGADGRHGLERAGGLRAAAGLDLVLRRADLCDEVLWNYFTHHGPVGVAVREQLVDSLFDSGRIVDLVASRLLSRAGPGPGRPTGPRHPGVIPTQRQVRQEQEARRRPRALTARDEDTSAP